MIGYKCAFLFFSVGLIMSAGRLWADDATPVSTDVAAPTAIATMASVENKPIKTESPLKTAMKAAAALAEAGKTDEAIAAYEKIGVLKSKKAEAWRLNSEGLAYLEATQPEPEKAVPLLENAVDADADSYVAWNNLGSAYEQTDQLDKAKDAYQKSIDAAKAMNASSDKAEANLKNLQPKLDKMTAKEAAAEPTATVSDSTPTAGTN